MSGVYRPSVTFGGPVPEGSVYTVNWVLGRQTPRGASL